MPSDQPDERIAAINRNEIIFPRAIHSIDEQRLDIRIKVGQRRIGRDQSRPAIGGKRQTRSLQPDLDRSRRRPCAGVLRNTKARSIGIRKPCHSSSLRSKSWSASARARKAAKRSPPSKRNAHWGQAQKNFRVARSTKCACREAMAFEQNSQCSSSVALTKRRSRDAQFPDSILSMLSRLFTF